MDRQKLVALSTRLKQIISETMPALNVTATAGFYVDSDVMTLSFHLAPLDGSQVAKAKAEARQA